MSLTDLTRADSYDSPFIASQRNIEVACGYALRTATKWKKRIPYWMDDVAFEEAVIAVVMRAAARYDPNNATKASFFTYCHAMVYGACLEEDRYQRRRKPPDQLDSMRAHAGESVSQDYSSGSEPMVADMVRDTRPLIEEQVVLRDTVRFLLDDLGERVLTDRELKVIKLRYMESMKQKDIAELFGITAGRVHQIEEQAIGKLRDAAAVEM